MLDFEPDANDAATQEASFGRNAAHVAALGLACGTRRAHAPSRPVRWLRSCLRLLAH